MKRLITRFECGTVRTLAAKIIKIQIRYMNRAWRKNNMKIISLVYQYVRIRRLDDWLGTEGSAFEEEALYLSQDEIRHLNSDFNYKHYGQYYEKLEEQQAATILATEQKINPGDENADADEGPIRGKTSSAL